eukprot:gene26785-65836_t
MEWKPLPDGKVGDLMMNETVFSFLFVTIPGMILFKIVFILYTCPMKMCHKD